MKETRRLKSGYKSNRPICILQTSILLFGNYISGFVKWPVFTCEYKCDASVYVFSLCLVSSINSNYNFNEVRDT